MPPSRRRLDRATSFPPHTAPSALRQVCGTVPRRDRRDRSNTCTGVVDPARLQDLLHHRTGQVELDDVPEDAVCPAAVAERGGDPFLDRQHNFRTPGPGRPIQRVMQVQQPSLWNCRCDASATTSPPARTGTTTAAAISTIAARRVNRSRWITSGAVSGCLGVPNPDSSETRARPASRTGDGFEDC